MPKGNNSGDSQDAAVDLGALKQQRTTMKRHITNLKAKIEKDVSKKEATIIECQLQVLESHYAQISSIQTQIETIDVSDNHREEIDDSFIAAKAKLLQSLNRLRPSVADASVFNASSAPQGNRLPKLKLPKFNGNYLEYSRFMHTFDTLVNNDASLTAVDKFNYLLDCLTGPALAVVEPFQISDENYEIVLNQLKKRFDNKPLIFSENIKALLSLPNMEKGNAASLRSLIDKVTSIKSSLLTIGNEGDVINAMLIHLVVSKLDTDSLESYAEKQSFDSIPSFDDCYNLLSHRCQYLESRSKGSQSNEAGSSKAKQTPTKRTKAFATTKVTCTYCQSTEHMIARCDTFKTLSTAERFNHAKQQSLCINCLSKGHNVSKCPSKHRCRDCQEPHHTMLHRSSSHPAIQPSPTAAPQQSSFPNSTSDSFTPRPHTALLTRTEHCALIPTAVVLIKDFCGVFQPVRALLDSCSEINLITEETAKRLRLRPIRNSGIINGVSNTKTSIKFEVDATIRFAAIKTISNVQPSETIHKDDWKIPSNIELADPSFYKPNKVDLLISSEIFFDLILSGKVSLGEGKPSLINTTLGWIVGGKFTSPKPASTLACHLTTCTPVTIADDTLKRFWEVEEYHQQSPTYSQEEQECEDHFVRNTTFRTDGRVQVRLPFKMSNKLLGDSFQIAQKRFLLLERRLDRDSRLKYLYLEFMKEYEDLGHMALIRNRCPQEESYFIPHHPVVRLDSSTTRLRVVFDASAKTSANISLNDVLMVRPTIQQDIITTLLVFRTHICAMTADIRKMHRQFRLHPDDCKYQRILWRSDKQQPLKCYELNTMTYGTSSALFLAVRSLFFIADKYQQSFPIGAQVLKRDLYVDDVITGADNTSNLLQIKNELSDLLACAKLELAKRNSNVPAIFKSSSEEVFLNLPNDVTKALGMSWKPQKDVLCHKFEFPSNVIATKRSILSITAKIFDLLGLLSPVIIRCKILLQELWIARLGWDDPLPETFNSSWNAIWNDLPNAYKVNEIEIPRYVLTSPAQKGEIHGFSDASERAYGCCIYVRVLLNQSYKTTLLIAKSKVAPVKAQSVPRLELCAALLLARTWRKFHGKFNELIESVFFWTDSKTVLLWLKSHASTLSTFVANRVAELQEASEHISWQHCPTHSNPADIVSRGCNAQELSNTIWFFGPEFLQKESLMWPNTTIHGDVPENEKRKSYSCKCSNFEETQLCESVINRSSSYLRILRVIAYIHRVFNKIKPNHTLKPTRNIPPLSVNEIDNAFHFIIAKIQHSSFASEISSLTSKKSIAPSIQRLAPFLNKTEIFNKDVLLIRVGGRLSNAPIPIDAKFPLLLPKDHRFVNLYVEYLHRRHLHAGAKIVIGLLRQQIWVLNVKKVVAKVIRRCVHCFKYKPKLAQQIMADLPEDRLKGIRPFFICGVDFCGPMKTAYRIRSKVPYKTYVAIFVCLASKAVHIELVSDLSSDAFIGCLKRFMARRGVPQKIYCDNATNFSGASNKLHEFFKQFLSQPRQSELIDHCTTIGFEFNFIPPRSPHFGGLWEAAVKSAKSLMVKHVAQANLNYEELLTIATEVEAILNSRPLFAPSDDPNDGNPLTPAHLICGTELLSVPEPHYDPARLSTLSRCQRITSIKQQFWRHWLRDYVLELQARSKWLTEHSNVHIGQLVIVHEDNVPPQQWVLARIVHVIPGADGKVRVADVQTAKGILRRSVHKLAPLPLAS